MSNPLPLIRVFTSQILNPLIKFSGSATASFYSPMNQPTSFIVWNTRGVNNDNFRRDFKELFKNHNPCMAALLETKMADHLSMVTEFGFDDYWEVPALGRSGGIVLLWHSNILTVTRKKQTPQEMHAMIQVLPNNFSWWFSAIYARTVYTDRINLWNNLEAIANTYDGPCLVAGAFNEVLTHHDKWGGCGINCSRSSLFWSCINRCQLIDLGFKGARYTWSNHRKRRASLILERLDRAFVNHSWSDLWPNTLTHSDHNPLLITINGSPGSKKNKPFRLEKFWVDHPEFSDLVKRSWENKSLYDALPIFTSNAIEWSKKTFGNIFLKKKKILARLEGIQNSYAFPTSSFLQNLDINLCKEYNDILKMEEEYWNLRPRINWLANGDANTKFFHLSVVNRRRRNRIAFFKDDNDNWITNPSRIVDHTFNYFSNCFTSNHSLSNVRHIQSSPISFHKLDLSDMDRPLQDYEITQAHRSKLQGLMAYTHIFFNPNGK
ncbi:hypothetical protein R3W88_031422 [Solanum pinnatisectum]|uniref:Endonuclease/exonuclease/phosphatase domain-containing protein n=1 Tax=Solanum pinnatisectum TaxID=50273 RepID=A0AAV9LLA1_9SOLN|nr:hypothetical protein R3W88_031422 [Solanum pinnatisectum]